MPEYSESYIKLKVISPLLIIKVSQLITKSESIEKRRDSILKICNLLEH